MRFFWPRAESRILSELKRLDREGLAKARRDMVGRRPRTTYSITAKGRRQVRDWLATPPNATALECEPLLRTMLGHLGDPEQLEAAVDQVKADANALIAVGRKIAADYQAGTAPFQEQVQHRALVFDFLVTHATGMLGWADRTRATLATWPDLSEKERRDQALALIETRVAALPER
jgi:DNA-binding PadR family transcriptional regulator